MIMSAIIITRSSKKQKAIYRIHILKLFILAFMLSSCVKEGHVAYRFELFNATGSPMIVHLSSWGRYSVSVNGLYDSSHKFHEKETITSHSSLIFETQVGFDPDPWQIPLSLTPAWEYVKSIECNGVTIPKEYFSNLENWDLGVANQINGTFTIISLVISPELIEQFSQNNKVKI